MLIIYYMVLVLFCRYNVSEEIAYKMGLDTMKTSSLWVDQVVVEVNIAILHSFQVCPFYALSSVSLSDEVKRSCHQSQYIAILHCFQVTKIQFAFVCLFLIKLTSGHQCINLNFAVCGSFF